MTVVRARYQKGVLTLLEPLDIAEGSNVMVSVQEARSRAVTQKTNVLEDMAALGKRLIEEYPDVGVIAPRTVRSTTNTTYTVTQKKGLIS